ncbi:MAG TPA: DUF551 domain-containing protein [Saprospiraceae bacterium]|nr:DUF551 domain-containing protein [Saprospiraceae bacterium]
MTEWINIKDKLPQEWQRVLAVTKAGFIGTCDYYKDDSIFAFDLNKIDFGKYGIEDPVTHWMPFPERPKDA